MRDKIMKSKLRDTISSKFGQVAGIFLLAALLTGCSLDLFGQARATQAEAPPVVLADAEIIAEGNLVPRAFVQLSFNYPGKVAEILVQEGDQVAQGARLVRLGDREQLEAAVAGAELDLLNAQQALDELNLKAELARAQLGKDLAQAQQALILAQQELDDLDTADFQDELDDAWIEVTEARDDVRDAEEELDKYKDLDKDNPTRVRAEDDLEDAEQTYKDKLRVYDLLVNQRDQVRADLALALARYDDLQDDFQSRQSGPHPDDLELAEASVRSAQAQLAAAQAALMDAELVAPYNSTVVELQVVEGEPVLPNQPVALVADFSEWYVETTDLTEMDVVRIDASQPVRLRPDAIPDLFLSGSVESISQVYWQSRGDITYTVRILLNESDPRLRWGMTFQVDFIPID
jgi:multidrug efflux pump subunit AcrA (membrane-fusion protein)